MKLKRVKIFGFKTFAERTEVELDGNIISIIGPNGCGKSNIVDSILWGLGETNARNLRAQTSKEVIFSGSGTRRPLGFAEVSLFFDNEDGTLPIDAAEVVVTRKLDRAGDSDYSINKRSCRLRDVNELLADSGLGRAGYAIVSQSDIDQALSASALQRRAWIDEAAGVQRYRARRTESLRRLESAEGHLQRVHDILNEIETQREPLREEAEVAKAYKVALSTLREIECSLLGKELAEALAELDQLEARINATMSDIDRENDRAESLREEYRESNRKVGITDSEIEKYRELLLATQTKLEQAISQLHLNEHKLESLGTLEQTLREEKDSSAEQLAGAESDLEKATAQAKTDHDSFIALEMSMAGVDEEAKALATELQSIEIELNDARQSQTEYERWKLEQGHTKSRIRQVREELEGIIATLPDLKEAVAESEATTNELLTKVEAYKATIAEQDSALRNLQVLEDQHAAESRKLLAQVAALDGRRRGIEATIEANEGLAQGTRAVLEAVKAGKLPADYTPVAHAIHIEPDLVQAIETALGAAGNDLIVPDESCAKRAIQFLKEYRAGRATFQPIPLMRPSQNSPELRQLLNQSGIIGLASELVECDAKHRPVIDSLLGRTVIVEDLDTALKLAKTRGWSKMVTLEGELVHASGAVTGGAARSHGTGVVQRKSELDEVIKELSALQNQLKKSQAWNQDSARKEFTAKRESAQAGLKEIQTEYDEARTWLMSLKHELTTTESSQTKLEAELARLKHPNQPERVSVDVASIEARRDDVMRGLAAKSSDAETAQARLQESHARSVESAERAKEAARRLEAMRSNSESRKARLQHIEPERERVRIAITESAQTRELTEKEVAEIRAKILELTEHRKSLIEQTQALSDQAEAAQKASQSCGEILHQCEIKRARADSRRSAATERLLEEYGLDPDEAVAQSEEALIAPDAPAVVAKLRRDLKAMGDVNLGAIDAFERLTERHDELHGQVEDIESGMKEIKSTIRELDTLTRQRFVETFQKLQVAFGEVFVRLLGGGEASLELTDPENILDSGVEISVTIPGKKRQRLELLSGGERAMSALAFLFSLLKVKPCPLVILDEVDAPLDGRNVERFISMMREFNQETQFILITHNNVTIESADVWLGVTMQEPGVSTVVPFRVPSQAPAPEPESLPTSVSFA
ncbi:MAG: chromosome segregation protein SMC [Fimbriimonadaceae bacterium]|nr:MAG: chromosome segregation protein SMC [Fimbriimonadaceae bacterium]